MSAQTTPTSKPKPLTPTQRKDLELAVFNADSPGLGLTSPWDMAASSVAKFKRAAWIVPVRFDRSTMYAVTPAGRAALEASK